jgi:hypothetical protein
MIKRCILIFLLSAAGWSFSPLAQAEFISCSSIELQTAMRDQKEQQFPIGTPVEIEKIEGDLYSIISSNHQTASVEKQCLSKSQPSLRGIQDEYAQLKVGDWTGKLAIAKKAIELNSIESWGWQMQLQAARQTGQELLANQAATTLAILQGKAVPQTEPVLLAVAMRPADASLARRHLPGILVAEELNMYQNNLTAFVLHDIFGRRIGVAGYDRIEESDCDDTTTYMHYRLDAGKRVRKTMLISNATLRPRSPDTVSLTAREERAVRKLAIDTMVDHGMPRRVASKAPKRARVYDEYFKIKAFDYDHNGKTDALVSVMLNRTRAVPETNEYALSLGYKYRQEEVVESYSLLMLARNDGNGKFTVDLNHWSTAKRGVPEDGRDEFVTDFTYVTHLDLNNDGLDEILVRSDSAIQQYILFQRTPGAPDWIANESQSKGCD